MYSTEHHIENLVELRVVSPFSEAEMTRLVQEHVALLQGLAHKPYVIATDMRAAHVFPAPITAKFISMMQSVNDELKRSAILINGSAVLGLQAERAIQEAAHPERRSFRRPEPFIDWLGEELSTAARLRLRAFLIDGERFIS